MDITSFVSLCHSDLAFFCFAPMSFRSNFGDISISLGYHIEFTSITRVNFELTPNSFLNPPTLCSLQVDFICIFQVDVTLKSLRSHLGVIQFSLRVHFEVVSI